MYCNRSCLWVCLWLCLFVLGSVTTITRICVHRSSPNWVAEGSDHLPLIKFWPSCAYGTIDARRGESFWLPLLQRARSVCISLSVFSLEFITQWVQSWYQGCYSTPCSNVQPATAYGVMEVRWIDVRLRRLNIRYLCQSVCSMLIRQICRMYLLRQQKITVVWMNELSRYRFEWNKCSERRKYCALAVVRRSQTFSTRRRPLSRRRRTAET